MQLQINPRGICSAIALLTFVCVSAATAPNGYLGCIELSSLSSAVTAGAVSISNWQELPTPAACFYRCSALGQARPLLGRNGSCSCAKIKAGKSWPAEPGDPILSAIGAGRCEPCPNRPQLICGSAASTAAMYSANRLLPSGKIFVNLTSRARQFERANLSLAIAMIGDFDNNISEFNTYTATRPGSKVVQIEFNYGKNSEFANLIINLVSQSVANVTMRLLSDHGSKFAFTNNIIVYKLVFVTNLVFKTNNSKSLSVELTFLPESVNQMVSKKWTAIDYDRIGCLASAQVAVNFTGKLGIAVTPMLLVSGHSGLLARFLADPVSVHSNLAIAIATIQGPSIAMINSHPSVVANYTVVAKLDDVTRIDWSLLRLLPSNDQSLNNPVFRRSIGNNKSASIELIANHGTSGGRFLITCRLSNPASELILSSRIILVAMPTAVLKPQLVGFESNFRQSTVGNCLMQTNPRLPAGWSGRALIRLAKSADWQPADLRIQIKVHMYSVNSNRLVDTLLANRLNSTHFSALINMSDYNRDDFEYSLSLTASFSEAGSFIRGQFLANVTIVPTFASAAALDSIVSSVVKSRDAAGLYSLTPKCRSTLVAQYASTSLPNSTQNLVFDFDFVDNILTESNSDNNSYGIVSIVAKGLFDSVIDCRRDVEISRVLRNVYVDRRQHFTRVESTAENLRLKMLSVGDTDPVVIGYEHSDG
uniref:REJ domain-containing protein n=1 Tax=Macrostomum lignano TaxID=282301 RepID=A0A1I8HST6_9PLAT